VLVREMLDQLSDNCLDRVVLGHMVRKMLGSLWTNQEEAKAEAARFLRRVRGYREDHAVEAWVRLIEPSKKGGWHTHMLVRLYGNDRLWERRALGVQCERNRQKGRFARVRIEPVYSVGGLVKYFVKTFHVGVERAHGQPVTFSRNVEKRRWWEPAPYFEPVQNSNDECQRWAASVVKSGAFQAALEEISADLDLVELAKIRIVL
jgi:hypothetical protein